MKQVLIFGVVVVFLLGCQTTIKDYKKDSVGKSLEQYQKELVRCFTKEGQHKTHSVDSKLGSKLTKGPWKKKTKERSVRRVGVIMAWDIDASGKVQELFASRAKNLKDKEKNCLLAKIKKWKFSPPPYGRKIKIEHPFRFLLEGTRFLLEGT